MTYHQSPIKKTDRTNRKSSLPNVSFHKESFDALAESQPILPLQQHRAVSCEEMTLSHASIDDKMDVKMEAEENSKTSGPSIVPQE
jgi:hypothetical protein